MTELERYKKLRESITKSDGKLIYAGFLLKRAAELWPNQLAIIMAKEYVNKALFHLQKQKTSEQLSNLNQHNLNLEKKDFNNLNQNDSQKYQEEKRLQENQNSNLEQEKSFRDNRNSQKSFKNTDTNFSEEFSLTYQELFKASLRVSNALNKKGIKPGDRVILLYENSIDFYLAYYGIWQIGAIVTPVNYLLHAFEISHIIHNAKPAAIIISSSSYEKMHDVLKEIPIIITQEDLYKILNDEFMESSEIISSKIFAEQEGDNLSALLYTSGTTGVPKGVMLSSNAILENVLQASARFDVSSNDKPLAALPLFHSYTQNTCIWMCSFLGVPAILIPKIDRKAILKSLTFNPTFILGIPQLYGLFCILRKAQFKNVRYFISGGDALSDKIRMGFELIYRRKICNGYGLTESSPFICVDLDDVTKPMDTVGKPFVGIECQLRDENNNILSKDSIGVLWVKGKNNMIGYYNQSEMTNKILVDGWLNTGDIATITSDNKIVLCGREKDLIKSKGIKVYPQEIENVIMQHPNVVAVGVVGKFKDDEEIPIAFVASKDISNIPELEKELKELCMNRLAFYEIPREFIIQESLPMTATGKVDKKALRKLFENK